MDFTNKDFVDYYKSSDVFPVNPNNHMINLAMYQSQMKFMITLKNH